MSIPWGAVALNEGGEVLSTEADIMAEANAPDSPLASGFAEPRDRNLEDLGCSLSIE
jgi:hypothetical protein